MTPSKTTVPNWSVYVLGSYKVRRRTEQRLCLDDLPLPSVRKLDGSVDAAVWIEVRSQL